MKRKLYISKKYHRYFKHYSLLSSERVSRISGCCSVAGLFNELGITYFDDRYCRAFKQALFDDSMYVDPFPLRGFSVSGKIERFTYELTVLSLYDI